MSEETGLVETDEAIDEHAKASQATLDSLGSQMGDVVLESFVKPGGNVWIRVSRDGWVETAHVLKNLMGFEYFSFLSAIDWMPSPHGRDMDSQVDLALADDDAATEDEGNVALESGYAGGDTRFQVFARVNDITTARGITIKVDIPDDDLSLPTWIPVYAGANWHEREVSEMFGITFEGHPNLRNLYLPGAFEGHPMRKDFALLSRRVKPWPGIVDVEPMPGEGDEEEQ